MKVKMKICERCKGAGALHEKIDNMTRRLIECPDCSGAGVVDA